MTLLAGKQLHQLIDDGVIDALHENVNAASIDVRLGNEFQFESHIGLSSPACLSTKDSLEFHVGEFEDGEPISIEPGVFFLAHTMETFNLPDNISAEFKLRSSIARSGLQHMLAGWADAGFHGAQLTLEFKNVTQWHTLLIEPGMRIGQMVFFAHEPAGDNSYAIKGRYNRQRGVQPSKGAA